MMCHYWKTQHVGGQEVKLYKLKTDVFMLADYIDELTLQPSKLIDEWQSSQEGQWITQHAIDKLTWSSYFDSQKLSKVFSVIAVITEQDYVLWKLKFQ